MIGSRIQSSQAIKLIVFLVVTCAVALVYLNSLKSLSSKKMMVGGLGKVQERSPEVVEILNKIKPDFEEKTGTKYTSLEVLSFKTQVVAGRNYYVKAKSVAEDGKEQVAHLKIHQDLKNEVSLLAYELDKKIDEVIEYIQ